MTTDRIARLSETIDTKFVVFIRALHQLAPNYMTTMLEYLRVRTAYLAEPVMYTGGIPNNVAATKIDDAYRWARDTDIFGVASTPIGSRDALEAIGDVDRSALYLSYRLYWSIGTVKQLAMGFTVASDTKVAIGRRVAHDVTRLVPLISAASKEVRLYLVRYIALFLRGMRAGKVTQVALANLRDVIRSYRLVELLRFVESLHNFPGIRAINFTDLIRRQLSQGGYRCRPEGHLYGVFSGPLPCRRFVHDAYTPAQTEGSSVHARDDFIYSRDQNVLNMAELEGQLDPASSGHDRAAWCHRLDQMTWKNRFFVQPAHLPGNCRLDGTSRCRSGEVFERQCLATHAAKALSRLTRQVWR